MSFIIKYSMPLAAALLLTVFFLSLPNLQTSLLVDDSAARRKLRRSDALLMALITLIYSCVAFYNLGNRKAPQSFADMSSRCATVKLDRRESSTIMIYTGVGIGSYQFDYSVDGVNYNYAATFSQSHADVLKWQTVNLDPPINEGYLRIYGSGDVWLGEVAVLGTNNEPTEISCDIPELCDEQELYQTQQNFMNSAYFDEIYHARTAWEHLNRVYPYEITHPPLGKLLIALGVSIFGMTPFGWRFSGTFFGVMMLPVMYIFLKKIFGGKAVPSAGTVVLASDFMHFVQSRISTIDTYAVFFTLLMYLFMYLFITEDKRLWLALSGITFGLGAASKWTCFYAGAGLAVIWLLWVIREARSGRLDIRGFLKNVGFCLVFFVAIPVFIYCLAYYPYAAARGNVSLFSGEYFRMVWANQEYMLNYHSGVNATHPYSSRWYQWMLDIRPILYYLEYFPDGTRSSFGAWLNPALCWGGLVSLFALIYLAAARKDKTSLFILIGYLAQLLPWVFVTRITFEYHYFACSVFLVIALAYMFEIFRRNMRLWKIFVFGFAVYSLVLFVMFYPALSGKPIDTYLASRLIGWLPTWPF